MKKLLSLFLLLFISMTLVGCKETTPVDIYDNVNFSFLGESTLLLEVGSVYTEKGFIARDEYTDISEFVSIETNIDVSVIGNYKVTYTLNYLDRITVLTRNVQVIPNGYSDVRFTLLGSTIKLIDFGFDYTEFGFYALDGTEDISRYVTIENNIDFSKNGVYTVTYTLDYKDVITVLSRTVEIVPLNSKCTLVTGTTTLECYKVWSKYLNTVVTLKVYIDTDSALSAFDIFDKIETIIARYHHLSDKYNTYNGVVNVKTINDNPTQTHTISEELFSLIEFTLDHQAEVDNLFNIALGPVLGVWHDYRENCNDNAICELPTISELNVKNLYTNLENIILNKANLTITMNDFMSIDLGGVSKGYISKIILEYLDSLIVNGFLLNNGESNISIGGNHPTRDSGEFLIAITDPTYQKPYYATVFLGDGEQLVTSGDYQQYFMVDGEIYHHIIHPVTLFPERYCRSVSIITTDPALADIYSTAIFLMPINEGKIFVNSIPGLEAIWYGIDGTISFSENFESLYLNALN